MKNLTVITAVALIGLAIAAQAEPKRLSKEEWREKFKGMSDKERIENCKRILELPVNEERKNSRASISYALECDRVMPAQQQNKKRPASD